MSTDRNRQARDRFLAQQLTSQQRQGFAAFAQDFASGRAKALDRFGQALAAGDLVLYSPPMTPVWQVKSVEPVLTPEGNLPIGTILLTLETQVPMQIRAGQSHGGLVKIGAQSAPGHQELTGVVGAQPDNQPPSADAGVDYAAAAELQAAEAQLQPPAPAVGEQELTPADAEARLQAAFDAAKKHQEENQ